MPNFIGIEAWEDSLKSGELKSREKERRTISRPEIGDFVQVIKFVLYGFLARGFLQRVPEGQMNKMLTVKQAPVPGNAKKIVRISPIIVRDI